MADISTVQLPDGLVYNIKDAKSRDHLVYSVKGTQTAATGSWTGTIDLPALYDGLTIAYYLPYNGNGNATLNLTLNTGAVTGAVNCYVTDTTRLTTHYKAGSTILLTYWSAGSISVAGTATTDDRWTHSEYDTNTNTIAYRVREGSTGYKTKTVLYRYEILLTYDDVYLLPVNTSSNVTATTKTLTSEEFNPFGKIFVYNTTGTVTAGNTVDASYLWIGYQDVDLRWPFNTGYTLTPYKAVYIVAEPRPNSRAVLHNPAITQTLPETEDGLLYIYFGQAYSTSQSTLSINHPVYMFKNGAIREVSDISLCSANRSSVYNYIDTFKDGIDNFPFNDVVVDIDPVQDLHGYDYPWAEGGGPNLYNGSNYTLAEHQYIRGSSPYDVVYYAGTTNRSIIMSCAPSSKYSVTSGAKGTMRVGSFQTSPAASSTPTVFAIATSSSDPVGLEITTGANDKYLFIQFFIDADVTNYGSTLENSLNGFVLKKDSNICPISGWAGCNITHTGANIWGGEKMANDMVAAVNNTSYCTKGEDTNGKYVTLTGSYAISTHLFNGPFKDNTQYTFIFSWSKSADTRTVNMAISYTDGTYDTVWAEQTTVTAGEKYKFVAVSAKGKTVSHISGYYHSGTSYLYYEECGWFEGVLTVNDYVPYIGVSYPFVWGKNLFDASNYESFSGYFDNGTHKVVSNAGHTIVYIPCTPNTTYTASRLRNYNNERFELTYSDVVPSSGSAISSTYSTITNSGSNIGETLSISITTGPSAKYLLCWAWWSSSIVEGEPLPKDTLQIEIGPTATAYTPYNGGIVYYGTLNPLTGVLTSKYLLQHITGGFLDDLSNAKDGNKSITLPMPSGTVSKLITKAYFSHFKWNISVSRDNLPLWNIGSWSGYTGYAQLCVPGTFTTGDEVNAWAASQEVPIQALWELSVPLTYQLTPVEINSFLGVNNFWADSGKTLLDFYNNNLDDILVNDIKRLQSYEDSNDDHLEEIEDNLSDLSNTVNSNYGDFTSLNSFVMGKVYKLTEDTTFADGVTYYQKIHDVDGNFDYYIKYEDRTGNPSSLGLYVLIDDPNSLAVKVNKNTNNILTNANDIASLEDVIMGVTGLTETQKDGVSSIILGYIEYPENSNTFYYGVTIGNAVKYTNNTKTDFPGDSRTYYQISAGQTFSLHAKDRVQFWMQGNLTGWFSFSDNTFHSVHEKVQQDISIGDWQMSNSNGFGIKYVG